MSAKSVTNPNALSSENKTVSIIFDADMRLFGTAYAKALQETSNSLDVRAIEGLATGLPECKDGHVVVLVPPFEYIVASSLSKGNSPEDALAEWTRYATMLVKRHRYYPSRTTFLDSRFQSLAPKKILKLLQDVLQIKLSLPKTTVAFDAPRIDPLYELVALGMLQRDTHAEKLRALVVGASDQDTTKTWQDKGANLIAERNILQEALDIAQTQIAAPTGEQGSTSPRELQLEEERSLLCEDITQMQQRLEREVANVRMLQLSKDAAERHLEKMANQIQLREVVLGKALLAEGRRHDSILTSLREEQADLLGKRDQLEHEVAERQEELQRVYASKSWRVTEPIRALRRSSSDS
ncbi:hypothetical protein [Shimia sagamensis]|uniref:Uncharacterized protein n=1 Tax=Shimia sagamensis TaxID=1566352 RepID=A0ABY1NBC3_9RHOB|nr:hypothetical protein [Shimia sagamensis]SMP05515.1 hypothetical protein SAMN06265373_101572 [Shimia sagamensis]